MGGMRNFFIKSACEAFTRAPCGARNGQLLVNDWEHWCLDYYDTQTQGTGTIGLAYSGPWEDPATRPNYTAQSPAASVTGVAGLAWTAINCYRTTIGDTCPYYMGFPCNASNGWPSAGGFGQWLGLQDYPDGTGFGGPDNAGLETVFAMTNNIGEAVMAFASFFCFGPTFQFAQPGGPLTSSWLNTQVGQRHRYRMNFPSPQMPILRMTANIYGQTNSAFDSSGSWNNGLSAQVISYNPAFRYPFRLQLDNFKFSSWQTITNFTGGIGSLDVSGPWVEVPMPSLPGDWNAATNAASGLFGLATVDYPGVSTLSQFTALTGISVTP
jgi:hypothetical protein